MRDLVLGLNLSPITFGYVVGTKCRFAKTLIPLIILMWVRKGGELEMQ